MRLGASYYTIDRDGKTPLQIAKDHKHWEFVEMIEKHESWLDRRNKKDLKISDIQHRMGAP